MSAGAKISESTKRRREGTVSGKERELKNIIRSQRYAIRNEKTEGEARGCYYTPTRKTSYFGGPQKQRGPKGKGS